MKITADQLTFLWTHNNHIHWQQIQKNNENKWPAIHEIDLLWKLIIQSNCRTQKKMNIPSIVQYSGFIQLSYGSSNANMLTRPKLMHNSINRWIYSKKNHWIICACYNTVRKTCKQKKNANALIIFCKCLDWIILYPRSKPHRKSGSFVSLLNL